MHLAGLMEDLTNALGECDQDPSIGAIVLTGNERAFAAGADIKEMEHADYVSQYTTSTDVWTRVGEVASL